MFFKKVFLLLTFSIVLWPLTAGVCHAADNVKPRFNPLCWEKNECVKTRADLFGQDKAQEGWLEKEGPECDAKGWGKCLAGRATKTSISFGGKTEFANIGDYIKTIYNYGLVALGILAVVMIIFSGIQWITSAGNSEVIGQSKKRIGGAIIGLFIAYMSYNILSSINPATVNLRLPQVWMLRAQVLPSQWCRDQDKKLLYAFAAGHKNQSDTIKATGKETFNQAYPYNNPKSKEFWCGQRFFIAGATADSYCLGDRCTNEGTVCADIDPVDEKNPYSCIKGNVAGTITAGDNVSPDAIIEDDDDAQLFLVCLNGERVDIADEPKTTMDSRNEKLSYVFSVSDEDIFEALEECDDDEALGFLMEFDFGVNNLPGVYESHLIDSQGRDIGYNEEDNLLFQYFRPEHYISWTSLKNGVQVNIKGKDVKICRSLGASVSTALNALEVLWKAFPGGTEEGAEAHYAHMQEGEENYIKCSFGPYIDFYLPDAQTVIRDFYPFLQ